MARRYSVDELLTLRTKLPFVICDLKKMNKEMSSKMVDLPDEVHSDSKTNMYMSKTVRSEASSRFYSSAEDEEERIVYRGHPAHPARRLIRGVAWQLRRRDSSDRSSQPFDAPSGVAAQKADNFRKFYRAVVSPTHVRVTAGGRIVPNTRAPPQPVFYWGSENQSFDSNNQPMRRKLSEEFGQPGPPWVQGVSLDSADHNPVLCGVYNTGLGSGITQSSIQPRAPSVQNISTGLPKRVDKSNDFNPVSMTNMPVLNNDSHVEEIKISPPTQFDTSKPFLYNGQLVYPVPPGFQPPFNILGNTNLPPGAYLPPIPPGMLFPQQLQFPAPPMASSYHMMPSTHSVPVMNVPGFAPLMMPNASQQLLPAPQNIVSPGPYFGSPVIFPSNNMVEQHIQVLQQQLKHLENQLENNRHQIDENHVSCQQQMVRNQITALQSSLMVQAYHQGSLSQPTDSSFNGTGLEGLIGLGLQPSSVMEVQPSTGGYALQNQVVIPGDQSGAVDRSVRQTTHSQPTRIEKGSSPAGKKSSGSPMHSEPPARKRLSAAAAMAPPFMPRSMQQNTAQVPFFKKISKGSSSGETNRSASSSPKKYQIEAGGRRKSSPPVTDWKVPPANLVLKPQPATLPKAKTFNNPVRTDSFGLTPAALQPFTSFNINVTPFSAILDPAVNDCIRDSTPYLMGFPPPGSTFERAASSELLYSRKLTEEEQRARHLYWGKAPSEATKGLPKFDGRDFYPASPVKTFSRPVSAVYVPQFGPGRDTEAYDVDPNWQLETKQRQSLRSPKPLNLENDLKSPNSLSPGTYGKTLKHKKTWERSMEVEDDDTSSVDSWGITKQEKREIFAQTDHSAIIRTKQSSPEKQEFCGSSSRNFNVNSQPSLLQDMLKHSPRSAMSSAMTGSSSPTAAQGFLPQYRSSAAAALAPSMSNVNASMQSLDNNSVQITSRKNSRTDSKTSIRTENQRPSFSASSSREPTSASDLLRKLKSEHHDSGFNSKTKGVGPVFGSDW